MGAGAAESRELSEGQLSAATGGNRCHMGPTAGEKADTADQHKPSLSQQAATPCADTGQTYSSAVPAIEQHKYGGSSQELSHADNCHKDRLPLAQAAPKGAAGWHSRQHQEASAVPAGGAPGLSAERRGSGRSPPTTCLLASRQCALHCLTAILPISSTQLLLALCAQAPQAGMGSDQMSGGNGKNSRLYALHLAATCLPSQWHGAAVSEACPWACSQHATST